MKRIPIPDAEAMEHRQRTAVLPPRPSSARCGRRCWAHAGEALDSRRAFEAASAYDQDSVIEFLKTLQVPAPGHTRVVPSCAECRYESVDAPTIGRRARVQASEPTGLSSQHIRTGLRLA